MNPSSFAKKACQMLDEKKAELIRVIDIREISVLADYFILANGLNANHTRSLCDELEKKFAEEGMRPRQIEGYAAGTWILLDYSDVVIHIFCRDERNFYDLERIWTDGKLMEPADL